MKEYTGNEKISIRQILFFIAAMLILAFIWSNSLETPDKSYSRSQKVLEYGSKILSRIFGTDHYLTVFFTGHVRKIAHFIEYLFLGSVVTVGMNIAGKTRIQHFYNSLSFSVITAVIDEFIQLYTYRGSSVRDVIIDFFGYLSGTLCTEFIILLFVLLRMIKNNNQEYRDY